MKNLKNNRQKGFTLIELVIVIVILGILAATAAPRFIDLTGDAHGSVMQGLEGSINSSTALLHSKALISSQTAATGLVTSNGISYSLVFGYPAAVGVSGGVNIAGALELSTDIGITVSASGSTVVFSKDGAATPSGCIVTYVEATSAANAVPSVTSSIGGC